jgi:hypothetical protein
MATTTNFGWTTPDDTDLVKDGAAAIRTALGGVDTSFVDLKGGTTGQVLAKASATDLDFVWSSRFSAGEQISTNETTTSTSFTNLSTVGPSVTLTTGTKALVIVSCRAANTSSNAFVVMGYEVTGASSVAPLDGASRFTTGSTANDSYGVAAATVQTLTAGSNTFTAKYRVSGGTGNFNTRSIYVVDLGS